MPSLIGNKPNQVPTNGDLGTLAFQDSSNVNITGGTVDVSAGTAALPTLGTTGDDNTGVFFPVADTVAVATNGAERVRIDASGNVGIGTASPTAGYKLDVNGAINISGNVKLTNANATNLGLFNTAASAINYGLYSANTAANGFNGFGILDITNSAYRFVIGASGGVSIGNTTDKGAASLNVSGLIFPQQAATAPAYVKGAIYFDTTLNKLRVGGATAWETITSV